MLGVGGIGIPQVYSHLHTHVGGYACALLYFAAVFALASVLSFVVCLFLILHMVFSVQ